MQGPRLRGSRGRRRGPYPLGQITDSIVHEVGKHIVHRVAIGDTDISGKRFADIFANAIRGQALSSSVGIADVVWQRCAWSLKTVKLANPFTKDRVRLVSGRNSPAFSHGISDPLSNIQQTGDAVLEIWNARVDEALAEYNDLRIAVLIRDPYLQHFVLFEEEAQRFTPSHYTWSLNRNENLEGREVSSNRHVFTWQPHGSQFTVFRDITTSARRFSIGPTVPLVVTLEAALEAAGFHRDWIEIHK